MRALVDTHAFFWWVTDNPKLSVKARTVLVEESNEILVSSVVAWELATKARLKKWPEAHPIATGIAAVIEENRFVPLAITMEHARAAGFLAGQHRDPFDRVLAAQSQVEGIPLISADPIFHAFGVAVMW